MEDRIVIGTCQQMCPTQEINRKEKYVGLLHRFEMKEGTEKNRRPEADRKLCVKEYSRPAAGRLDPHPSELRPAKVLLKTTNYLIDKILTREDCEWSMAYEFVFDRLRAIRQDMVIQRLSGQEAVLILETAVRFHIYAGYRLCKEHLSKFDDHINRTHTLECVKRLLVFYDLDPAFCKNEAEFTALYLLYNLDNTEALFYALNRIHILRESHEFQKALEIAFCYHNNNYVRLMRLCQALSELQLCAIHRHLQHVQSKALCVMSSGFSSKNLKYPISHLCDILNYDNDDDASSACQLHNLVIVSNQTVTFLKANFKFPEKLTARHFKFIDEKLENISIPRLLYGESVES